MNSVIHAIGMFVVICMLAVSAANPDRPPLVIGIFQDLMK